jgi:hypothetical protein
MHTLMAIFYLRSAEESVLGLPGPLENTLRAKLWKLFRSSSEEFLWMQEMIWSISACILSSLPSIII